MALDVLVNAEFIVIGVKVLVYFTSCGGTNILSVGGMRDSVKYVVVWP